jgi:hypothetical protein
MGVSDQLSFSAEELLASNAVEESLYAGGVRCHGGFDADGRYVSPRTLNRWPAIGNWQARFQTEFGRPPAAPPIELWPRHYPNEAQTRLLLHEGVRDTVIATLTRVGTVEGFGAGIRMGAVPDIQRYFDEDLSGTATAHLNGGLFEAHARDEAGFEDEGGHKQMWFAARDMAFEEPDLEPAWNVLAAMGFPRSAAAGTSDEQRARARMEAIRNRLWPTDIDFELEAQLQRMINLIFIEISAFHTFAWAEAVLADTAVVAGEGVPAQVVSYIRADETPHVAYLMTSVEEMRKRTLVGTSGRHYAGEDLIGRMWDASIARSQGQTRRDARRNQVAGVALALASHPRRDDLLEEFHSLGDIRPNADGEFERVHHDGGSTSGY